MYLMQVDAYGPDDRRCAATNDKIAMIQETGKFGSFEIDRASTAESVDDEEKDESVRSTRSQNPVMKMFKKISKKK